MAGIEQIAGVARIGSNIPVDVTHFIGNNTGVHTLWPGS